MRLHVHLLGDRPPVEFTAEKIVYQVDGDGELAVKIDRETAAVFARGQWSHAVDPDLTAGGK